MLVDPFLCVFFSTFSFFFPFAMEKDRKTCWMLKKMISSSKPCAKHLFAGQNAQWLTFEKITIYFIVVTGLSKAMVNHKNRHHKSEIERWREHPAGTKILPKIKKSISCILYSCIQLCSSCQYPVLRLLYSHCTLAVLYFFGLKVVLLVT